MGSSHESRARAASRPWRQEEYPWHVPFTRAVRHLPIGMMDVRVLEQRKIWVDSASRVHRIRDLSDEHLENIVAMLRQTAVSVFLDYSFAAGLGRFRPLSDPPVPADDVREVAQRWLTTMPLWHALHAEMAARTLRRPDRPHRLDATEGIWAIRTERDSYVLDLDDSRLLIVTAAGTPSRSQPQWEPLPPIPPIRVGRPLRLDSSVHQAAGRGRRSSEAARVVVSVRRLPIDPESRVASVATAAMLITRLSLRVRLVYLQTEYRTPRFLDAAGDVRAMWAALTLLISRHRIGSVALVPSRLRDAGAPEDGIDIAIAEDVPPSVLVPFQADVDAAVGHHLPVTTLRDYAPLSPAQLAEHGVALSPGT